MPDVKRVAFGELAEINRFPVKSMHGERLSSVVVNGRGLEFDRLWAVRCRSGKLGSGKSTRRFEKVDDIGFMQAHLLDDGVGITLPDGTELRSGDPSVHEVLSRVFQQDVRLERESHESHFDDGPVHVVTRSAVDSVQRCSGISLPVERLRANLLIHDSGDDTAGVEIRTGDRLHVGHAVVLEITQPMTRCVMVNNATTHLPRDGRVLKALSAVNDLALGWVAEVVCPGVIALGDETRVL